MNSKDFIIGKLKLIQKKHPSYFKEHNVSILDCVVIKGTDAAFITITNSGLPFDIKWMIVTLN
ncbi:hypothetical protein EWM62_05520 [Mucilaginibacter terrigena]|uniref:Uncharacterized protein n=1 Tax=Mucilaginibacter terrigena TaxID=2492395 RepID=A0A4Q5LPQ9_9SPHI|nr:hypothetical protein [Mucilaginibacter terrigena]RYU91401.1 hypothetical protein EWM62_05520 [Mucilaginibacter terrigena]